MTKRKLYKLTSEDFELPSFVDQKHQVVTSPADSIPVISWPNGRSCFVANAFILKLYHRGLSRKNRGGTLTWYAGNITHLLRYCFDNRVDAVEITDNHFTFFVHTLLGQRRERQPEVLARDSNQVIAIGRSCLEFLSYVADLYGLPDLLGPEGRIRATRKEQKIRLKNTKRSIRTVQYWDHHSFPTANSKKKRPPISSSLVNRLRSAVLNNSTSIYLRKRRYIMLLLLEITGGRRSEIAALTVGSVLEASKMREPMLRLITAKKRTSHQERMVPVASNDLGSLLEFIHVNRRRLIRSTCGLESDDGYLLCSETTGLKLRPNTITQEIAILAKAADIDVAICPHMFRHRFITKVFVALIEYHQFTTSDSFRRALFDTESIKQKLQQWTGHANIASLDGYIDLAFEEVSNFSKTYDLLAVTRMIDSMRTTAQQLQLELGNGLSLAQAIDRFTLMLDACQSDICRLGDYSAAPELNRPGVS